METGTKPWMRLELFVLVALVLCALLTYVERDTLSKKYEDMMFALDHSAEKAYGYGTAHFDAINPDQYDIDRAEYFFEEAQKLDPTYPMLNHQLARIAFLRANFPKALEYIDKEIELRGDEFPNTYYVRALIYGYQGRYLDAAKDYETYFKLVPANWAGINDYSWVLLKADLPEGAHEALSWGLKEWPENAWLLHNEATALYEMGRFSEAKEVAVKAETAITKLSVADWLHAYPGNDPKVAEQGLSTFKTAAAENIAKIKAVAE